MNINANGTMSPSNVMRITFLIVCCVHVYVDDFVFETNILNRCSRYQSCAFLTILYLILYANAQNVLFGMLKTIIIDVSSAFTCCFVANYAPVNTYGRGRTSPYLSSTSPMC